MDSNRLRTIWKEFWESPEQWHKEVKPSSLIPDSLDNTVLFNTAGMQQLVPFLMWKPHPQWKRVYNIQKCLRTVDIEEVWDSSHLTMFEMMWNWSLWDYFKEESINWSYKFIKDYLKLDLKKLAVTVFEWDSDAPADEFSAILWEKIWIPKHKISYMWKDDNWWGPAWETWPCWPDTEIFYRVWPEEYPPEDSNKKNDDDNWVEIWNNVFMEYYKDEKWNFEKLSSVNVDTWMWFERIMMTLEWVDTVYETDLFKDIMSVIENFTENKYPWYYKSEREFSDKESSLSKSMRIIADHIRTSVFMIWDWVIPSNESRWYILRRIIRRMYYNLWVCLWRFDFWVDDFITEVVEVIVEKYWDFRIEIRQNKQNIIRTLINEMNQFQKTITKWKSILESKIHKIEWDVLFWKDVFDLYDTYWFPYELTLEIAGTYWFKVDEIWFIEEMEKAKERSRQWAKDMFKRWIDWAKYLEWIPQTEFVWYDNLDTEDSKILKEIDIDWKVILILDKTPFYAESGWQTWDRWVIETDEWKIYNVVDVQKYAWVFLHFVE